MIILAGLGNPGPQYARNRHNIGAVTVDAIAREWGFSSQRSRFSSLVREGAIETATGTVRALIMKPQTFYNESGRAVAEAVRFFKADPGSAIIFYDEIDLALGRFRMKVGGGAAGNNGIRSIAARLGPDFRRARMGTGHPGHKDLVQDYVLSDFRKADAPWLAALIDACAKAAPLLAAGEDERYQAEVLRLAPAPKLDPRASARAID
ncbi:MAG TPA: aminoacyl-tRNA hydrolase [Caulobacteraceae bacterium]